MKKIDRHVTYNGIELPFTQYEENHGATSWPAIPPTPPPFIRYVCNGCGWRHDVLTCGVFSLVPDGPAHALDDAEMGRLVFHADRCPNLKQMEALRDQWKKTRRSTERHTAAPATTRKRD